MRRIRQIVVVGFLLVFCVACAAPPIFVLMKHPQTGELRECRGYTQGWIKEVEDCVKAYERQGYVRQP